ncbi:hypothetical protein CRD59_06635 [Bifidobacterium xylocopae]|uniref:Uncharacterized protein n=1 Tax=Bifidobacterium xylocopae TaxID=2493119 RepID=A0A366KCJ8_9BIFI|nr:hypothetical protein CRD59_06635 [Bifidobacterium xylocopae]
MPDMATFHSGVTGFPVCIQAGTQGAGLCLIQIDVTEAELHFAGTGHHMLVSMFVVPSWPG